MCVPRKGSVFNGSILGAIFAHSAIHLMTISGPAHLLAEAWPKMAQFRAADEGVRAVFPNSFSSSRVGGE